MINGGSICKILSFSASSTNSPADKTKNKGGQGSKKQVFESYMTSEEVSHGLKRGELIQVQIQTYCKLPLLTVQTPVFKSASSMDKNIRDLQYIWDRRLSQAVQIKSRYYLSSAGLHNHMCVWTTCSEHLKYKNMN